MLPTSRDCAWFALLVASMVAMDWAYTSKPARCVESWAVGR